MMPISKHTWKTFKERMVHSHENPSNSIKCWDRERPERNLFLETFSSSSSNTIKPCLHRTFFQILLSSTLIYHTFIYLPVSLQHCPSNTLPHLNVNKKLTIRQIPTKLYNLDTFFLQILYKFDRLLLNQSSLPKWEMREYRIKNGSKKRKTNKRLAKRNE